MGLPRALQVHFLVGMSEDANPFAVVHEAARFGAARWQLVWLQITPGEASHFLLFFVVSLLANSIER